MDEIRFDTKFYSDQITDAELESLVYSDIFQKLRLYFKQKGLITRESSLKSLFDKKVTETEWSELNSIGYRIPVLQMSKAFNYWFFLIIIIDIVLIALFFTNYFDHLFAIWTLPVSVLLISGISISLIPLMYLFKHNRIPCETVGELIEKIIILNWDQILEQRHKAINQNRDDENNNEKV
jgi:hypothetical protein